MNYKRVILLSLVLLFALSTPVFAGDFAPFEMIDVEELYDSYWQIIDFALYFALLLAVTRVGLAKAMKDNESGAMKIALVLSLLGSVLLLLAEIGVNKRLAEFSHILLFF